MSPPNIGYNNRTKNSIAARTSNKTCFIYYSSSAKTSHFATSKNSLSLKSTLNPVKLYENSICQTSSKNVTNPQVKSRLQKISNNILSSSHMLASSHVQVNSIYFLLLFTIHSVLSSFLRLSHCSSYNALKNIHICSLLVLFFLCCANNANASEFPERECCDPIYPVATSTSASPPSAITVPPGKTGLNVRTSIAILNCLLARQLCFEDASCSAILEIIPRVCGSELVACSTVTVTKCQAALRTLQAFPFFKPTCLCKEPNVDPECNSFRDFLFDHPCVFVLKKEKDPYPVEALPTCNYALNVCHSEKSCAALFDTFKLACRARDGDCRMDDKDQCREAWAGLRMSPLFGCICPNNHMKKRCDRIFAMVNHNPCVDVRKGRIGGQDLFLEKLQRLRHSPKKPTLGPPTERHPDRFNLHPSKLPDSLKKLTHHGKHHRMLSLEYKSNVTRYVAPDGTILLVTENGTQIITDAGGGDLLEAIIKAMELISRGHATVSASRRHPNVSRKRINPVNAVSQDGKKIPPSIANGNNRSGVISTDTNKDNHENNWVSGIDLGPEEGFEFDDNHISPHIMEEGHRRMFGRPGRRKGGGHHSKHHEGPKRIGSYDDGHDGNAPKISLKSTCQLALDRCIRDKACTASLTPILQTCDTTRCDRDGCMESLRNFYRTTNVQWNLEIAFCLCKKTDNKEDACMNAQEKLHPVCAQREPGGQLPFCHVLAQTCRENPECRMRLEMYEQSCAVDSVTKRCAGSPEACRTAVLNMLGTDLRTACACKGTEYNHLYDCLGWQRLLWLNPCVVESQSDFHIKTYGSTTVPTFDNGIRVIHEISSETGIRHTTSIMVPHVTHQPSIVYATLPPKTPINTHEDSKIGRNIEVEIVQGGTKEQEAIIAVVETTTLKTTITTEEPTTVPITTTLTTTTTEMETTTVTTTTSTTPEPIKYCVVQRPELDDQFVQKGHTKRLYRDAELDCSELCHCDNHLSVSCHAVCVRHAPCRTALAYYSHAAPAYQAYRGRCYCYSGSFICMRPNPGEYSLPPGVYLLLGFSSQDEALLRPHTRLGLEDAVRVLQEYMLTLADDGTNCTLTLFNVTNENMIITASVPSRQRDSHSLLVTLDNDKMECTGLLETLKSKINSQDYDISSHLLLSIFKIAEVDIIFPPPSSATAKGPSVVLVLGVVFFVLFLQDRHSSMLHLGMHEVGMYCTNIVMKINVLFIDFMIQNMLLLSTIYNVMSIALDTVAHFFYLPKDFVVSAMIFFHFFPQCVNNDKNDNVDLKFTIFGQDDMINKMQNLYTIRSPDVLNLTGGFVQMKVNNFVLSEVMPFARLFYKKTCFLYTLMGTIIPRTTLALRDYTTKHISIAVNFIMRYYNRYIISVKCIFCRSVHLENMTYSIYHTIEMSLLTIVVTLLLFVVNFAKIAAFCTIVFSARIKTEVFLLIIYEGFLVGVQGREILIIIKEYYMNIIKNTKFNRWQSIFLNNVLRIENIIIMKTLVYTAHNIAAILSFILCNKMASLFINYYYKLFTHAVSFYTVVSLLRYCSLIISLFLNEADFTVGNVNIPKCSLSMKNVTGTACEEVFR